MTGGAQIEIRDFAPDADRAGLEALWTAVFGHPTGGQTIEWLFRPGPAGASPRAVATADGRIVGHAGATALRFQLGATVVRGGYSVAAMTDPALRGQRLFFRMGEHLYRRMEEQGFAFVAGFSNQNSFRLMTGPLQRTPLRPFPWCVRPLAPWALLLRGYAASRRLDGAALEAALAASAREDVRVSLCAPDDPRFEAVWQRAAASVGVGAVRDAAFVAWRFGTRPDAGYRLLLAERGGVPAGWLAYRGLALRGIPAGFVVDAVIAPGEAAAGRALLRGAVRIAGGEGCALISALMPARGPIRSALLRSGFVRVPEPLHPQVIRFSVRGLGARAAESALTDRRAWTLAWSDTDVV